MKKKFLRLCISPESAYGKKYSDCVFSGMLLPCIAYVLFALNVSLERASFIPSYGFIKILLLSFIGLVVGAFSTGIIAASGFIAGKIAKKEINGLYFLGCVEFSFTVAVIIEFIGLIMRIFGTNISSVFGILGIFSALVTVFAILKTLINTDNVIYIATCAVMGFILMLGMNIVFFVPV